MTAWFKPKRYGFGAAPASWQGWALTAAYVAIVAACSVWLANSAVSAESRITPFMVIIAVVTIIFVGIAWRTTEGGWRWRWGDDEKR